MAGAAEVLNVGLVFAFVALAQGWLWKNESFGGLVLLLNSGLVGLAWGVPVWIWALRTMPRFATGWAVVIFGAGLINGLCTGFVMSH